MADINTQKFTNVSGDNLVILPDTSKAKNGDVLTFSSGTSGVIWHAPQSGGGGSDLPPYDGNTKAVLVADEGNVLSWDWGMYFATTDEVGRKINGIQTVAPLDGFGSAGTMVGDIKLWYDETLHTVPNTISSKERDMLSVTNPVPNPSGMNGKVLTVEHNDDTNTDDIVWKDAGGGGGGDSSVMVLNFKFYSDDEFQNHLIDDGKDINKIIQAIEAGKHIVAQAYRVDEATKSEIVGLEASYPLSYFYYSEGEAPQLFFSFGLGSGGGPSNSIQYNGWHVDEPWPGPWSGPWTNE